MLMRPCRPSPSRRPALRAATTARTTSPSSSRRAWTWWRWSGAAGQPAPEWMVPGVPLALTPRVPDDVEARARTAGRLAHARGARVTVNFRSSSSRGCCPLVRRGQRHARLRADEHGAEHVGRAARGPGHRLRCPRGWLVSRRGPRCWWSAWRCSRTHSADGRRGWTASIRRGPSSFIPRACWGGRTSSRPCGAAS